ncbi:hypothetical protein KSX_44390 [Ktedonospora formicarum]|uniref:Phosphoribulokinase/uridine kinase domain-containing protein n=2 Tax=Ktedonospora formicarum TaxID=2778364 RepID=A0A8J3I293_9CHLR|nr:hypothetical protein KSX_44390 [Ktedonospora formicarum]
MPPLLECVDALPLKRIYLIAGPAASGKTTFATTLARHMRATLLSMDHYYLDEDVVVKEYDEKYGVMPQWESPDAYDVYRMREDIDALLTTGSATIPSYSFVHSRREGYQDMCLDEDQPLIIEGLYAIRFSGILSEENDSMLKLYIHAETEERRARSHIRDVVKRGKPLADFEKRYHFVDLGEKRWVLRQMHDADFVIESTNEKRYGFFQRDSEVSHAEV